MINVLEGSLEIAKKGDAIFIVEVHSCDNLSILENTDNILKWSKQNDYKAYYLCEHREILDSSSIKDRGRYHLLLIHKNTEYPDGLNNIKQSANIEQIIIN